MSNQVGQRIAGEPTAQMSLGQYLGRLLDRVVPPTVVSGPLHRSPDGKFNWARRGEDPELLERTRCARGPKETVMEFIARTGLGAHQIRSMSREEILRFVAVVSQQDEFTGHPTTWVPLEPKTIPAKFLMV
jgi:hypothetical protein